MSLTKSVEGVADGYDWSFDFTLTEEPDGAAVTQTVDSSALPESATAVVGRPHGRRAVHPHRGRPALRLDRRRHRLHRAWRTRDEAEGFQFTVTPGLELECTALNTAIPTEVELTKTVTGLADGAAWSFDFTITPGPDSESDTQTATNEAPTIAWGDLLPGVEYSITESATPGWVNGEITCIADVPEGGPLDDLDPEADGFQFLAEAGTRARLHGRQRGPARRDHGDEVRQGRRRHLRLHPHPEGRRRGGLRDGHHRQRHR